MEDLEKAVLDTIKLHIETFIDTEELLREINSFNTKKLENKDIENMKQAKEKEVEKISIIKRGLYEDWKNDYITKEEYLEYKQKYEQDIDRIKEIIANFEKQKEKQKKIINNNSEWIDNFKQHKNITKLDRVIILELIDCIEVYENNKITIHFKFTV